MKAFLLLLALALIPATAIAEHDRTLGTCSADGTICVGPEASVAVLAWDFDAEQLRTGVSPGLGYGLTFLADQPWSLGLGAYLSYSRQGDVDQATPAIIARIAEYIRVGIAWELVDGDASPLLLFGAGLDFGPTL